MKDVARKLDYMPDPVLAALNVYRQKQRTPKYQATLAWLNAWPNREGLQQTFEFEQYWGGAKERAREFGYGIEEFWLYDKRMTPERLARVLRTRQIQGIFLPPAPVPHFALDFPWQHFCIVAFGYSHEPKFHLVTNSMHRAARLGFSRLYELGYRRIAFISSMDNAERTDFNFYSGTMAEAAHRGLDPAIFFVSGRDMPSAKNRRLVKWLERAQPDALLVPNYHFADALQRENIMQFPRDAAIAVLSLRSNKDVYAGVYLNNVDVGATAAVQLIALINQNERGIPSTLLRVLVEGVWQDGTTAPRKTPVNS